MSVAAARREHVQPNDAKPSYAIYPQTMQQRPHLQPSADFREVYQVPCQKPTTHYGSTLRKNNGGKIMCSQAWGIEMLIVG